VLGIVEAREADNVLVLVMLQQACMSSSGRARSRTPSWQEAMQGMTQNNHVAVAVRQWQSWLRYTGPVLGN